MVDRTNNRVKVQSEPMITFTKFKRDCSSCLYEVGQYECKHPLEGTKAFKSMSMAKCWRDNKRIPTISKLSKKKAGVE